MPTQNDFEICIICALPLEARAIRALFEAGEDKTFEKAKGDTNIYSIGRISGKDVVLAYMPGMGKVAAAGVAGNLKRSFENIKLALLVGICGGVPGEGDNGVRLGDVIVGKNVVHYDFGRQYEHGFEMKDGPGDRLGKQGPEIGGFVGKLESGRGKLEQQLSGYLDSMLNSWKPKISVDNLKDVAYPKGYWHIHQDKDAGECWDGKCENFVSVCKTATTASCEELGCERADWIRPRDRRPVPRVFFGTVASGDKVMRSAAIRNKIAKGADVLAFDMEAAGVWDFLPCILIKGVCDYSDSHKNKSWQEYAAISAAAFTRAALEEWASSATTTTTDATAARSQPSQPTIGSINSYGNTQFNNHKGSKVMNQASNMVFTGNQTFSF
ncbi:hypothetical protein TWF481_007938 [Arthrobotrys musiformis]|uniref:Nucleoside phosphorylase domain-containing protein n=1 Tax=Arthrobotrys musiformis TaxID=47236 RepID=A0AAV9W7P2_9PEZI